MIDESALAGLCRYIAAQKWTYAKTMPTMPHEYIVRGKGQAGEIEFVTTVEAIRAHGYKRNFHGRAYTYLNIDGYRYWTMGNPMPDTTIINRTQNNEAWLNGGDA